MKASGKVLFFLMIAAIFTAGPVGCEDADDCVACGAAGCPTLGEALESWFTVLDCCAGINFRDYTQQWTTKWQEVPPALLDACVGKITCSGLQHCGDDAIAYGDDTAMDACMRDIVDSGATSCSGGSLKIVVGGIGCMKVDCGAYCGGSGDCVDSDAAADCSCGFLRN